MGFVGDMWVGFGFGRYGEICVEDLVNERSVGEARWVAERESGARGFDEIWMYVFGLVAIFE